MKFSKRLRDSVSEIWQGFFDHPFVTGIGDGSLDIEKFKFFMVQDYLYLFDYAKVFALGVVKSLRPADMRRFAQSVEATLNGEMSLHRAYMKRLGISLDEAESARPALANTSYTSYMLKAGFEGDIAAITAAILACSWSYAEIGARLNKLSGAACHELYGEWITGYACEEYQAQNASLIALMDELSQGLGDEEKDNLEQIFVNCSRYEAAFWDMAWKMEV